MTRLPGYLLAYGLASAAAFGMTAAPAAATEISVSLWTPPGYPFIRSGLDKWLASMEEESGGSLEFTLYEGGALGPAKDHYDMAATGIADITWIVPGYLPGRFPIFARMEIPYTLGGEVGDHAEAFQEWYLQYADTEMSEVKFLLLHTNDFATIHMRDDEVRMPDDLNGKKLRPANAAVASWLGMLGASSVQVPAPESREAVARGTVDGITLQWGSAESFGIEKVTSYHLDDDIYTSVFAIMMNKDKYASLTDAEKKVIDDHATPEWARVISESWAAFEKESEAQMKADPDRTIIVLDEESKAAWRASAAPLLEEWKADVKAKFPDMDPDALDASLQEHLKAHNAQPQI